MKINRIFGVVALLVCFIPGITSAQSFWLHKPVYGNSGFQRNFLMVASDTQNFVFVPLAFDPALTTDYGKSWKYIFADTVRKIPYYIAAIVHPTHDLIILGCDDGAVGHVLRSTDAGANWTDTAIGSSDTSTSYNSIGAMSALGSNIFVPIASDHYLYSSDAGLSWDSITCPVAHHFTVSYNPSSSLVNPVACYPEANDLIVAEIDTLFQDGNFADKIYKSTDRGKTWSGGFQMPDEITKIAFINSLIGFASGFIWDGFTSSFTATIDKTTDGGLTWSSIFSQQIVTPSAVFNSTSALYSIAFADSLHGMACGSQGLILQTTDGGRNWSQMTSDYTSDDEGGDVFGDVTYPDTAHAMIASSSGEALIYQPNGILSLPNITYPHFSPPSAPSTFDITWDPVPNATWYAIKVTGSIISVNDTVIAVDSNVTQTSFHLSNLPDHSPTQGGVQYEIYLQAFNSTNQSNMATRAFIVYQGTNGVAQATGNQPNPIELYPNPATNWITIDGFSGPLVVSDALGCTRNCPWQNGKLNVANLSAGIYYVRDRQHRARFMKEK